MYTYKNTTPEVRKQLEEMEKSLIEEIEDIRSLAESWEVPNSYFKQDTSSFENAEHVFDWLHEVSKLLPNDFELGNYIRAFLNKYQHESPL